MVFKDWEKMNSEIAELGLWDDDEQPLPTSECMAGAGSALRRHKSQQHCYAFAGMGAGQRHCPVCKSTQLEETHRCCTSALGAWRPLCQGPRGSLLLCLRSVKGPRVTWSLAMAPCPQTSCTRGRPSTGARTSTAEGAAWSAEEAAAVGFPAQGYGFTGRWAWER